MKRSLAKLSRRIIRAQLGRSSPAGLLRLGEKKLLRCFRRAVKQSAAYRIVLQEAGVDPRRIASVADFRQHCPLLEKATTFGRFKLQELIASDIRRDDLASVLTSSGHGGNGYALGLSTRQQLISTPTLIDLGLDMAFDVDRYRTLLINCLPMGVTFQSNSVCVANVSVREDMACAIVDQSGHLFEQIILCGDPLFLKRLCDYSQAKGVDWGRYRMNVIIGEETFPESFRDYLASILKIDPDGSKDGLIGSSMGVGELGLNLFNETRESIAIRRACNASPVFFADVCGATAAQGILPTFLAFNPLRTFVEIISPDAEGIGDLVVTVMDMKTPVPLMRYRTGDKASIVDLAHLKRCMPQGGSKLRPPSLPIIALHGRAKDYLPGGWHVDMFKEALYTRPETARHVSGAFRISSDEEGMRWDVQIGRDVNVERDTVADALQESLGRCGMENAGVVRITCHAYADFPYGQGIDYERKFTYWTV